MINCVLMFTVRIDRWTLQAMQIKCISEKTLKYLAWNRYLNESCDSKLIPVAHDLVSKEGNLMIPSSLLLSMGFHNPLRPRHLWPIAQYHYSHAIFRDCHAYSITFNCSLSLLKHLNGYIPTISQFPAGIISKWFSISFDFLINPRETMSHRCQSLHAKQC